MPNPLHEAAAAPAALSAFLRGVERRGAVFAELQCGDQDAGDTALAAAMRAFRTHAGAVPMADWPQRFWSLLVANPQLRQTAATAHWPAGLEPLRALDPTLRQALLLRLAAGLAESDAAPVLGMDAPAYEAALGAACPRDADGQPDAVAWRSLAEAIQFHLRELPPLRLARLARLREAAITGTRLERPNARVDSSVQDKARPRSDAPTRRRRWPWVLLVLLLIGAALAATWYWPRWQAPQPLPEADGVHTLADDVRIESEALPETTPASRYDAGTGLLLHPDFEQLADPREDALAQEADFLAWIAAGAGAADAQAPADPAHPQGDAAPTGTETTDAQF